MAANLLRTLLQPRWHLVSFCSTSAIGLGSLLYGTEEINGQGYFAGRDSLTAQFGKLLIEAEGAERAVIREVLQGLDIDRLRAMFPAE